MERVVLETAVDLFRSDGTRCHGFIWLIDEGGALSDVHLTEEERERWLELQGPAGPM